jgi:hypothetical protein
MEDIKCEQDSIKWVTNNTPFLINTAKKCKHQCINPFSSFNAFKKVTEYLGKRLWELLNNKNSMKYEIKAELLYKYIEKLEEYLKYILKYACVTESEKSIRMTNFENELASLKSQLLEQKEDYPVYDENYLKECMDKSRLNKPGIADDDK